MASTDTKDTPTTTGAEAPVEDDAKVCVFKKPVRGNKNIRKKPSDATSAAEDDTKTTIVTKDKSTKRGIDATTEKVQQTLTPVSFASSGSMLPVGSRDQMATATLEIDTEHDKDGVAIKKRAKVLTNDGLYHGLNQYSNYIEKRETTGIKGVGLTAGPVRASSTIRMTSRMDYQPDLCKDYKETGYCGYGDACKFMHDRGDYKTGWQLEKEWEEVQKRKKDDKDRKEEDGELAPESTEEELPFACYICRNEFGTTGSTPVVTKCKHYFCEKCALDNHTKTKRCFICNELTGGIFNHPRNLIAKLEEKKKREEAQKVAVDAEGATVVDGGNQDD